MGDSDFDRAFTRIVAPQLDHLGFRMITQPEGWIIPSKLYEREPVWFGADWDWRDGDLAVTVGRLFRFRDFMPRVLVRGPYHYDVVRKSEKLGSFLSKHLSLVVQDLPDAVEHMQERWPTTPNLEKGGAGSVQTVARPRLPDTYRIWVLNSHSLHGSRRPVR